MAWRIETGSRSIEFTDSLDGVGLVSFPEIEYDSAPVMRANARRDGRAAGRDLVEGQVVSLEVEVRPDHRPLDQVWAELVAVWRADEVRHTPGRLARLYADSGRCTYGRPRPLRQSSQYRLFNTMRAELKFESIDDLWYGPQVTERVRFSIPESGGLRFPAEAPFTFDSGPTQRNGVIRIEGEVATMPVFRIQGPVTNPSIKVTGIGELKFDVALKFDEVLVVDTRAWAASVRINGNPRPGVLSASGARLSDMALRPKSYEVILRGYDPTGTGYLDVQVEPAFTSFGGI